MSNTERNKKIVREFLDIASRSPNAVGDFLADDLAWTVPCDATHVPFAGTMDKPQLLGMFSGLARMMPSGLHYDIKNLTAEGDRVACEAEGHADSIIGPFRNRYHFLFELHDGKIVAAREYCDSASAVAFVARAMQQPSST